MIESPVATPLERAIAQNNRSIVSADPKRERANLDQAIASYSEAIRLAPRYLSPPYNPCGDRAQAKEAKGDRQGAARDRALMAPLYEAASRGARDIAGPNASGLRAWEFIPRSEITAP